MCILRGCFEKRANHSSVCGAARMVLTPAKLQVLSQFVADSNERPEGLTLGTYVVVESGRQ